jgi:hypothetical protein
MKGKYKATKGAFGSKSLAQKRRESDKLRDEFEADRAAALKRIETVDKERRIGGDNIQTN